jgi:hypothetical protein
LCAEAREKNLLRQHFIFTNLGKINVARGAYVLLYDLGKIIGGDSAAERDGIKRRIADGAVLFSL